VGEVPGGRHHGEAGVGEPRGQCPLGGAMSSRSAATRSVGTPTAAADSATSWRTEAWNASRSVFRSANVEKYRPCSAWIQRRSAASRVVAMATLAIRVMSGWRSSHVPVPSGSAPAKRW
jgi:hypothetical protein